MATVGCQAGSSGFLQRFPLTIHLGIISLLRPLALSVQLHQEGLPPVGMMWHIFAHRLLLGPPLPAALPWRKQCLPGHRSSTLLHCGGSKREVPCHGAAASCSRLDHCPPPAAVPGMGEGELAHTENAFGMCCAVGPDVEGRVTLEPVSLGHLCGHLPVSLLWHLGRAPRSPHPSSTGEAGEGTSQAPPWWPYRSR